MKVLIGAIGTNPYEKVEYEFSDGERVAARFFMVGLAKKIGAEKVLVLLTEDAKVLQWEYKDGTGLEDEFKSQGVNAVPIDIPKGLSEGEAWDIFSRIAENIPDGAEVTIDVTHGLRSIPFLLLLSINYLRSLKNARIVDVYYGAMEGTDRNENVKPAYSLGAFITLLDWSLGVEYFKRSGNLEILAALLEERQTALYRTQSDSKELPTKLKSVAKWLRKVSAALDLTRPDEILESSDQLIKEINEAEKEFPIWAKPFALLLGQITSVFRPLALSETRRPENIEQNVKKQFQLIEWYRGKQRYQSAIILLREWYTSWSLQKRGEIDLFDLEKRGVKKIGSDSSNMTEAALDDDHLRELTSLRNDVAHAGMRPKPDNSDALKKRFEKAFSKTQGLIE